jgi:hypothetical protein
MELNGRELKPPPIQFNSINSVVDMTAIASTRPRPGHEPGPTGKHLSIRVG